MTPGPPGAVPFSAFMEAALYGETSGFYATGGRAGRRGDFLTSPEVGPLFGAVIARALDAWWRELGEPAIYDVVEAGAGPGTMARSILDAQPDCIASLRYTMVERAEVQRRLQPSGPQLISAASFPDHRASVVLANELLDNLPFDLLVFDGAWREAWVVEIEGSFREILRPTTSLPEGAPLTARHGARAPRHDRAAQWVRDTTALLRPGGRLVAFDYCSTTSSMAQRPWREWLRTYRQHERGGHYLQHRGHQDITCDVALDQLPTPVAASTQAQWLAQYGIEELVASGRALWAERGAIGDLAALKARSRVREAEALCDPTGLGAFSVVEWRSPRAGTANSAAATTTDRPASRTEARGSSESPAPPETPIRRPAQAERMTRRPLRSP